MVNRIRLSAVALSTSFWNTCIRLLLLVSSVTKQYNSDLQQRKPTYVGANTALSLLLHLTSLSLYVGIRLMSFPVSRIHRRIAKGIRLAGNMFSILATSIPFT